jgi:hypothetical protein
LPVRLYFDHNVSRAITQGLRLRGVDVLTAYEDRAQRLSDPELIDRATILRRVVFSSDEDLIVEARRRQRDGAYFSGVIFAPQEYPIGACIEVLEVVAKAGEPEDFANSLMFLPRR